MAALFATGPALAGGFEGKTAAYVDWAVRNCGCTSTDQEHKLVEQANATPKGHDAFQKDYLVQFQSKELTEALAGDRVLQEKCEALKASYGPAGSRIAGLITWPKAPVSSSTSAAPAAGASPAKRGRRHAQ